MTRTFQCSSPEATFEAGERLGASLASGDVVLLYGGLGADKTLFTKGILHSVGFDVDEVTSPSFTLVNLYKTDSFDVYHVDLWRLDAAQNVAAAVGLEEILENENAVTIIEWADRLTDFEVPISPIRVSISGDGDDPRQIRLDR